jgi:predicted membrane channel-forming protein YqfA (hemolysin III family)
MEFVVVPRVAFFLATSSLASFSTVANVVTSLPFIALGLGGLRYLVSGNGRNPMSGRPSTPFAVFVLSLILVGAGSVFYHAFPSANHLLWDRLPIAICLAAFACVITDSRLGSTLLLPVLAVSVSSVVYWYVTATRGHEDLRPYAAVQVGVVLWAVVVVFRRWRQRAGGADLRWALAAYAVGRIVELFEQQIYHEAGVDLGHPLKHLLVALAAFLIIRALASPMSEQETAALQFEASSAG